MDNLSPASFIVPRAPGLTRDVGLIAIGTVAVCIFLFVWTIGSGPNLGDEAHHWRRATVCFETASGEGRLMSDPAYPPQGQSAIRYFDSAGWYLALAMLWKAVGRPIMWAAVYPRFLLNKPEEAQGCILYYMRVDYIAIHPSRFIDKAEPDTEPRGYPKSWVRSLRERPYLTQVYPAEPRRAEEGGEFVVYRVDRDKIPPAWLNNPLFVNDLPNDAAPPPALK